jgi:hypothetical protein
MVHIFYVLVIQNLFKNIFKDKKRRLNSCKLAVSSVALGLAMAITTPILSVEDTAIGSLENSGVKCHGLHIIDTSCERASVESVAEIALQYQEREKFIPGQVSPISIRMKLKLESHASFRERTSGTTIDAS